MSTYIYFLILAILSVIVIYISTKTCLLRDIVVRTGEFHENAVAENRPNPKAPYSLARTQLAFWTVIITGSFLYVFIRDKFSIPELNDVNLILLGIAVTTTAAGKLIDDSQKNRPDLNSDYPSQSFIIDILSDKNGVSIHRLQNVLWTLIIGVIYVHYVAAEAQLPDDTVLTNNILLLMGISTGAYVTLKATENTGAQTMLPGQQ